MKITFTILITLLPCVSCVSMQYPFDWAGYTKNGVKAWKNPQLQSQIKKDMILCGFRNTDDNLQYMKKEEIASSESCMNKRGYLGIDNKKACDYEVYQNTATCKNQQ